LLCKSISDALRSIMSQFRIALTGLLLGLSFNGALAANEPNTQNPAATRLNSSDAAVEVEANTDALAHSQISKAEFVPAAEPQIVLTPYRAKYRSNYHWGFLSFRINGVRTLEQLDEDQWRLTFEAEASAASVKEESLFRYQDNQIFPEQYRYRASGLIQEDDRSLDFNHENEIVLDKERQKEYNDKWQPKLQDMLSYMQQVSIDLALGKATLSYPVYDKTRVKTYGFEVLGEEPLNTAIGKLKTIKVRQIRRGDREILAWLAVDQDYLLVQMEDSEKGDLNYRIKLVSLD
jgi:hypothetical protein